MLLFPEKTIFICHIFRHFYKVIEILKGKAREYGTKIIKVSEEYKILTYKCCGNIKDDTEKKLE
jgi:hypothetical protein